MNVSHVPPFFEILSTNVPVAQWIERRFPKASVAGSIPAGDTLSEEMNKCIGSIQALLNYVTFRFKIARITCVDLPKFSTLLPKFSTFILAISSNTFFP
jgi:hypothetical protein